jgi:hypothetical protein
VLMLFILFAIAGIVYFAAFQQTFQWATLNIDLFID